jgi:hypothetical protein
LGDWSDAFKTSESVYQLINRQSSQAQRMKTIIMQFYDKLAQIFWQNNFHLFNSYSHFNFITIQKANKQLKMEVKQKAATHFILSCLCIPLNNQISNFERLTQVYYNNDALSEENKSLLMAQNEFFNIARMLNIKGTPSREAILNQVTATNLQHSCGEDITQLYRLMEEEKVPFKISKTGFALIKKICASNPEFGKYEALLTNTLAIRVLQKLRNYYTSLKLTNLYKHFSEFCNEKEVEVFLYKCNRNNLIHTVLNYSTNSISFERKQEVIGNLKEFGVKVNKAFNCVLELTKGQDHRVRVFQKVSDMISQEQ